MQLLRVLVALGLLSTGCAFGVMPEPIPVTAGLRGSDVPGNAR